MAPNAIDKALLLLDLLIVSPAGLRAVDLLRRTGYPPGTLHRLLGTLVRNGYVRQDATTTRYVLGPKFSQAFNSLARDSGLAERAVPHLRRLAQFTGHAANLGVLRGDQVVYLESVAAETNGPVLYTAPGTTMPAHCTAMGRALLAHLADGPLEGYVPGAAERGPAAKAAVARLEEQVRHVHREGYAVDEGEYRPGMRCVAAPVRQFNGQVIAALSVTAQAPDLTAARRAEVVRLVIETARAISADLGHGTGEATSLPRAVAPRR